MNNACIISQKAIEEFKICFNLSVSKTEQLVETSSNIENNKVVSLKEVTLKHKGKKNNASIFTSAPK